MRYYILANGEGTRWGNYMGVPKMLVEIDGETILARMVRLLKEEGVKKKDIVICGPYEDENATTVITKSKTKREVFEEIANLAKGPFTILYGDVYYTKECIHEVVTRPIKKYDEFFTISPNPNTGCKWAEGYAHRCKDWKWWRDTMHEINTNAELIRTGKDWFIHWWLLGERDIDKINSYPEQCYNQDHDIFWCDQTDDFDYPEDLDTFCEVTGHECTNGKVKPRLSVIIPHYENPNGVIALVKLFEAQIEKYPETELIVIDDGSDSADLSMLDDYGFVKFKKLPRNMGVSAARNAGLDMARGEYIAFCDCDDQIMPNYLQHTFENMDEGYDYVVYPFLTDMGGGGPLRDELIANYAVWSWLFRREIIGDKRFDEKLQVAEDVDFLRRVINKKQNGKRDTIPVYRYLWLANQDSLCKRFNRGEIKKERE